MKKVIFSHLGIFAYEFSAYDGGPLNFVVERPAPHDRLVFQTHAEAMRYADELCKIAALQQVSAADRSDSE